MSKKIQYRLGIDLGASSLGWCILPLNNNQPVDITHMGVRIFSDGRDAQTYTPLSVNRREKRGLRRQHDRFVVRKKQLMDFLIEHNLMPKNLKERKALQEINPYCLRAKALDEKLELHELGRALFHLNQRRGFKSNRIQQKTDPNEAGATKLGIRQLKDKIEECKARTLGEYFYLQTKDGTPIRIRPKTVKSKNSYDIYPERTMYEDEFEQIWKKQAEFHSPLNTELKERIKYIIFYQRQLKPQTVGTCTFEEGEKRAPSCLRTSQRFRVHQEINTLELRRYDDTGPCLTAEQKHEIKQFLLNEPSELKKDGTITFDKLRKKLHLSESTFNLEDDKRKDLKGDKVMKDFSSKDYFGPQWLGFSDGIRDEIILRLLEETDEQAILPWLIKTYSVSPENAERISDYRLPDRYSRLSVKAMQKILPFLEAGQLYSDACRSAGYHHSDFRPGEKLNQLPYYGEALPKRVIGGTLEYKDKPQDNAPTAQYEKYYGKINNPTVHVGLNQLRKLVNSLIDTYGHPAEIVVELARELKLNNEQRDKIKKEQAENKKRNERINAILVENGIAETYQNRLRYKLWEELANEPEKRCCPFSGRQISITDMFSHEFEIEHLIPFSLSFDDSPANKTLSYRQANRDKGNRTPYEAFGHNPAGYDWQEISARAENLPANKKWRFQPNAMEKIKGDGNDMIARQIHDTQYLSRTAKEYLAHICDPNKVWVIPGRLTALLRDKWGVNLNALFSQGPNKKDRLDNRHHAIDAFVAACTTHRNLELISLASANSFTDRLIAHMPPPMENFETHGREKLKQLLASMVISHKPDHKGAEQAVKQHSTTGELHQATAYGFVEEKDDKIILTVRKSLDALFDKDIKKLKKNIESIRDPKIKEKLLNIILVETDIEKIKGEIENNNIRRVRILDERSKSVVFSLKDKHGKPYKWFAYGNNYCADIYCPLAPVPKWQCEVIPAYCAHQPNFIPEWRKKYPAAKLIMRLFQNDMVAYEENGETVYARVQKMNNSDSLIFFVPHTIAKPDDKSSRKFSAKQLQERRLRRIAVDMLGRVKDPLKKRNR